MVKRFNPKEVCVVLPAYNEASSLPYVIKELRKHNYTKIVVVDDGSKDETYRVAKDAGVSVYQHLTNKGLGTALKTGLNAARLTDASYFVTFDSDGQHDPQDIEHATKPLRENKADVVIGSRLMNPKGMPPIRRFGNWAFNIITYVLFRVWTTDSQSGLRAFNRYAAEQIDIKTTRMEVSSEIIAEVGRHNLRFAEVPIRAIYTEYSRARGQSSLNGFNILFKLILKRLMK
jgi:glycosyltransferase involved in cell wall biosynthesis